MENELLTKLKPIEDIEYGLNFSINICKLCNQRDEKRKHN